MDCPSQSVAQFETEAKVNRKERERKFNSIYQIRLVRQIRVVRGVVLYFLNRNMFISGLYMHNSPGRCNFMSWAFLCMDLSFRRCTWT